MAKAATVKQSTIRAYARGQVEPPRDVLIRIAENATVHLTWLATGAGPRDLEAPPELATPSLGVADLDQGATDLITAAAKLTGVPVEYAALRLRGSPEIQGLRLALSDWSASVRIPLLVPKGDLAAWGIIDARCLPAALRRTNSIAAFQLPDLTMSPQFEPGDWVLVATDVTPNETGHYCVERPGVGVEVQEVQVLPNELRVTANKNDAQLERSEVFTTIEAFRSARKVLGRVVCGVTCDVAARRKW